MSDVKFLFVIKQYGQIADKRLKEYLSATMLLKTTLIKVEKFENGLKMYPGNLKPTLLNTHDDHRIAMSLALIGSKVKGIQINDPGYVSKTCPQYFKL